jgi:23S rRNA pseudouridine1911/1915/1917 synthase
VNDKSLHAEFKFEVIQQQAGKNLLEVLLPAIPYLSEVRWLELLNSGLISIDGDVVQKDTPLLLGQRVQYVVPDYEEGEVDTNWKLLWEGKDIVAVHKPANLPVSRTTRNVYNTLIQLLRRETPWPDVHLLHRLDLETSGIILIGKDKQAATRYQPKLNELIKKKVYRAWVYGSPSWNQLDYECDLNTIKESPIRCQMYKVDQGQGKTSRTVFSVKRRVGEYSLIECQLMTGRKHQIRAHLNSLGHPIVGDKIYSNRGEFYLKRLEDNLTEDDYETLLTDHHLLHAYKVELDIEGVSETIVNEEYSQVWKDWEENL